YGFSYCQARFEGSEKTILPEVSISLSRKSRCLSWIKSEAIVFIFSEVAFTDFWNDALSASDIFWNWAGAISGSSKNKNNKLRFISFGIKQLRQRNDAVIQNRQSYQYPFQNPNATFARVVHQNNATWF